MDCRKKKNASPGTKPKLTGYRSVKNNVQVVFSKDITGKFFKNILALLKST
jgi:hypothetical protein